MINWEQAGPDEEYYAIYNHVFLTVFKVAGRHWHARVSYDGNDLWRGSYTKLSSAKRGVLRATRNIFREIGRVLCPSYLQTRR